MHVHVHVPVHCNLHVLLHIICVHVTLNCLPALYIDSTHAVYSYFRPQTQWKEQAIITRATLWYKSDRSRSTLYIHVHVHVGHWRLVFRKYLVKRKTIHVMSGAVCFHQYAFIFVDDTIFNMHFVYLKRVNCSLVRIILIFLLPTHLHVCTVITWFYILYAGTYMYLCVHAFFCLHVHVPDISLFSLLVWAIHVHCIVYMNEN